MSRLILPPLRRTSADAAYFAATVHKDQTDDVGELLSTHLARVALGVRQLAEGCPFWSSDHRDDAEQVAWLHHVLEVGGSTARILRLEGFSLIVTEAAAALAHIDTELYHNCIKDFGRDGGLTSVLVKIADLDDALDPGRLSLLPNERRTILVQRYQAAKFELIEAARRKGWQENINNYI